MINDKDYYVCACMFIAFGVLLVWMFVNGVYGASTMKLDNYEPIVVHFYEH
jgi:hypothetical protein